MAAGLVAVVAAAMCVVLFPSRSTSLSGRRISFSTVTSEGSRIGKARISTWQGERQQVLVLGWASSGNLLVGNAQGAS